MANRETKVQRDILLAVAGKAVLFRNNCGSWKTPSGSRVRYGVASPGGSDLIGWRQVVITRDMVGSVVAVFTAVEVKPPGWTGPDGTHEFRQAHFIDVVRAAGGKAGFAASEEEALKILD